MLHAFVLRLAIVSLARCANASALRNSTAALQDVVGDPRRLVAQQLSASATPLSVAWVAPANNRVDGSCGTPGARGPPPACDANPGSEGEGVAQETLRPRRRLLIC